MFVCLNVISVKVHLNVSYFLDEVFSDLVHEIDDQSTFSFFCLIQLRQKRQDSMNLT